MNPTQTPIPIISIIVPFKNKPKLLKKCISSIILKSKFQNYEIIGINNRSSSVQTKTLVTELTNKHDRVKFFDYNYKFNYSSINNLAAKLSKGKYLVFLNNDTEVIKPDWLNSLLKVCKNNNTGVVGARLLFSNHAIQHDGIVFLNDGTPVHLAKHLNEKSQYNYQNTTRKISAVTGACMMIKKSLFESVGGFDEKSFPISYNDVELSLKLHTKGFSNYICSNALLYHHESKTRSRDITKKALKRLDKELMILKKRYPSFFSNKDPFLRGKAEKLLNLTAGTKQTLYKYISRIQKIYDNKKLKKIALYGAGQHTERLLKELPETIKKEICAVIDDYSKKVYFKKIPVKKPSQITNCNFDLLVISSDTIEDKLYENAQAFKFKCQFIFAPYSQRLTTL